ncbi:MAG: Ni/Fe hydrogenase subunit alpha [Desulfosalsimonadaceae bacterium]|nr:Ni/Fe hydrogenase subunit alpha [Desulfosalsimonadaceae bacterium]
MKINLNVDVHHLARFEGHGNIKIKVEDGNVREARWDVVETPRFFEAMLKNKHYTAAGVLAARICGICSISHSLCSITATEQAFNVTVPDQAAKLRLLAKHAETLQSHVLHVLFLAAPDFFGEPSVIPLIQKKPEVVAIALRLKGFANRLCDAVAGRTTHPVTFQVGGVTAAPAKKDLLNYKKELEGLLPDLTAVAELVATLTLPDFVRETEFVSLKGKTEYPFICQDVTSTDGVSRKATDYLSITNEYVDASNTSKWTRLSRESYAVGALARFNNNHTLLRPEAVKVASDLKLAPVCHNPFMNNVAQVVESIHAAHEIIRLIDELADTGMNQLMAEVKPKAGEGVGAVEAPRGILFHHYEYDKKGRIVKADCVVPSTQNNANIHHDMQSLVRQYALAGMTDEKLELLSSMLVRSYDPCLSCSVH